MKITVTWNFGNFTPTVEAEVSEEAIRAMLEKGATQVLQRVPAGEVEKSIMGHTWPLGKRGNPTKPDSFSRTSIPFTAENAEKVKKGFTTTAALGGEDGPTVEFRCVGVQEHVPGQDNGPGKTAAAVAELIDDDMAEMLRVKFNLAAGTEKAEIVRHFLASKRK